MTPEQREIVASLALYEWGIEPHQQDALRACLAQADKVTPEAESDRREGARLRQIRETLSASTAEHSPVTLAHLEAAAMGAEADRRLGATVREVGDAAEFDRLADRCRDRGDDEEGEDAFRDIADAIREESER